MKIAIAGYGIEGKASYDYWNTSENSLTIVDEREALDDLPDGAQTILGAGAFEKLAEFDLIVRSPSVPPRKLPYGDKVWSATNEFFAKCPAQIIGVTGTKGKGTTSSLIASILKAAGKTVHLIGNIGTAALAELPRIQPDDIVVYELSSFQLWDITRSPHVAVFLNLEPDHLNVHENFADYVLAKSNIARFQTSDDIMIFYQPNPTVAKIASMTQAKSLAYPFAIDEFVDSLKLPGVHNRENASAAIAAVRQYGVNDDEIRRGLADFTGLPHRLKFVREVDGVSYYDDSIATTPGSAVAAIASFGHPKILLLGGQDKGGDYTELLQTCAKKGVRLVLYGENRHELQQLSNEYGVACQIVDSSVMADVVTTAATSAQAGDVVILSPAAASFDMFKSYVDRGEQFIAAVEAL